MKNAVVVGGGITGLLSAIMLKEQFDSVYVIEKESKCGGLLRSVKNDNGVYFDMGTHIPAETLMKEVDEILFKDMGSGDWDTIPLLKVGNVFCGQLYDKSQYVYTPYMEKDKYSKGLIELLSCTNTDVNRSNLFMYSSEYFGDTFTKEIFAPLMRKLLGEKLENLHTSALHLFSYTRLIPGDANMARELKKSPIYDQKLAYASFYEGVAANRKFYPNNRQGVELWVDQLVKQAVQKGVTFLNDTTIINVNHENDEIKQITIHDGTTIDTDVVVWTVTPAILLKLVNIPLESTPLDFRKMTLHNYVFDCPFLTDNHYFYCSDEDFHSFRVTLYPNISSSNEQKAPYNCTVEVLTDQEADVSEINEKVLEELKIMGIVSSEATLLYKSFVEIRNGFPIVTNEFVNAVKKQKEIVNQNLKNVVLVGKASGEVFFINEAVIDTYRKIEDILSVEGKILS